MSLMSAPSTVLSCRSYSVQSNLPRSLSHMPQPHQPRIHFTPHCESTSKLRARWAVGSRSMCVFMAKADSSAFPTPFKGTITAYLNSAVCRQVWPSDVNSKPSRKVPRRLGVNREVRLFDAAGGQVERAYVHRPEAACRPNPPRWL